jgi:hypothetical protein
VSRPDAGGGSVAGLVTITLAVLGDDLPGDRLQLLNLGQDHPLGLADLLTRRVRLPADPLMHAPYELPVLAYLGDQVLPFLADISEVGPDFLAQGPRRPGSLVRI